MIHFHASGAFIHQNGVCLIKGKLKTMFNPTHISLQHQFSPSLNPVKPNQLTRFGLREPFSVLVNKNQAWNRLFIEMTGYAPWSIGFARNKYERLENDVNSGVYATPFQRNDLENQSANLNCR
jgi:hypothetical protein